jgi:hypothetical protein
MSPAASSTLGTPKGKRNGPLLTGLADLNSTELNQILEQEWGKKDSSEKCSEDMLPFSNLQSLCYNLRAFSPTMFHNPYPIHSVSHP